MVSIALAKAGDMTALLPLLVEMVTSRGGDVPKDSAAYCAQLEADGPAGAQHFECLIARLGGTDPVGFAIYSTVYDASIPGNSVFLCDVFVTKEARQQGVGKAIMIELAQECLNNGGARIGWHVARLDLEARTFFDLLAPDSFQLNQLSYNLDRDQINALAHRA